MSGASCASAILGILTGQSQSGGSELVVRANTLQAFRSGILILTLSAVLLYTIVCTLSVRKLLQTEAGEEGDSGARAYAENGRGPA